MNKEFFINTRILLAAVVPLAALIIQVEQVSLFRICSVYSHPSIDLEYVEIGRGNGGIFEISYSRNKSDALNLEIYCISGNKYWVQCSEDLSVCADLIECQDGFRVVDINRLCL